MLVKTYQMLAARSQKLMFVIDCIDKASCLRANANICFMTLLKIFQLLQCWNLCLHVCCDYLYCCWNNNILHQCFANCALHARGKDWRVSVVLYLLNYLLFNVCVCVVVCKYMIEVLLARMCRDVSVDFKQKKRLLNCCVILLISDCILNQIRTNKYVYVMELRFRC